jgi:hypothetical protein
MPRNNENKLRERKEQLNKESMQVPSYYLNFFDKV